MTSFFYAIAAASEAFFKLMPYILKVIDLFFVIAGVVLTIGWIRHMLNNPDDKGWYDPSENTNTNH